MDVVLQGRIARWSSFVNVKNSTANARLRLRVKVDSVVPKILPRYADPGGGYMAPRQSGLQQDEARELEQTRQSQHSSGSVS
jgi:hypothetical protein